MCAGVGCGRKVPEGSGVRWCRRQVPEGSGKVAVCAGVSSGDRFRNVPEGSGVCWCRFRRQVPEGCGRFRCVLV